MKQTRFDTTVHTLWESHLLLVDGQLYDYRGRLL